MATSRISKNTYILYTLLVLATAFGLATQTAPNTLVPAMAEEFGVGLDVAQWLTTLYLLGTGVVVPVAAYWSHRFPIRSHLAFSLVVFMAGSFVCFIAPNIWIMLVGRGLQSFGAGVIMPAMQAAAITRFPPGRQATAMGVAGIALGLMPNLGPTICGAMDAVWGWRSFFLLVAVLYALLLVITLIFVKEDDDPNRELRFDVISFVQGVVAFGGILLGISNISSFGLASPLVWVPEAIGIVMLVVFLRRQSKLENPLISMDIFKSSRYAHGQVIMGLLQASFVGITLIGPLYVQNVLGGSSLDAGIVLLPATFIALVINPVSGVLADKYGSRPVCLVSGFLLALGAVMWIFIGTDTPLWLLMVYQGIRAAGISGIVGPAQSWSLTGLEGPLVPDGSSFSSIIRQVSAALGTALMVLAINMSMEWAMAAGMPVLPYQLALGLSALLSIATFLGVLVRMR